MKYVPLFDGILESTLWDEPLEVRTLYFSMLLLMDADFVVRLDFEKIARKARLRENRREGYIEAQKALAVLMAPDERTMAEQADDGIRIQKVEDGYFVVSGEKYQELMYEVNKARRRKRAQQERRAAEKVIRGARPLTGEVAAVRHGVVIHEHREQKPQEAAPAVTPEKSDPKSEPAKVSVSPIASQSIPGKRLPSRPAARRESPETQPPPTRALTPTPQAAPQVSPAVQTTPHSAGLPTASPSRNPEPARSAGQIVPAVLNSVARKNPAVNNPLAGGWEERVIAAPAQPVPPRPARPILAPPDLDEPPTE